MKKFPFGISLFLLVFAASSCAQKLATVKISCIQPYCGGAKPTPQMEEDAQKLKPYSNKTVILVSEAGKIDSAKTNSEGVIKSKLAPGKYKLYEAWRYYKGTPNGDAMSSFDQACLEKEWSKYFMEVTRTKKSTTQKSDGPIVMECPWKLPCINEKFLPPKRQ
jgi:hypothetical protein